MKKKRIRYSELAATPEQSAAAPPLEPIVADAPVFAPEPSEPPAPPMAEPAVEIIDVAADEPVFYETHVEEMIVEAPMEPRPRRNSTPVELARALAAAQLQEAAKAVREAEEEAASDAARPAPIPAAKKTDLASVLVFRIGPERFAVDLLAIEEVVDLPVIHYVPEMPAAMVGVVTVRGALTPVFTAHAALGLPLGKSAALLIFRRAVGRVSVLIDDVEDATTIDLRELRKAPGSHLDDNVVLGVIRRDGNMFAVVDADALIAACQSAALQETQQ